MAAFGVLGCAWCSKISLILVQEFYFWWEIPTKTTQEMFFEIPSSGPQGAWAPSSRSSGPLLLPPRSVPPSASMTSKRCARFTGKSKLGRAVSSGHLWKIPLNKPDGGRFGSFGVRANGRLHLPGIDETSPKYLSVRSLRSEGMWGLELSAISEQISEGGGKSANMRIKTPHGKASGWL